MEIESPEGEYAENMPWTLYQPFRGEMRTSPSGEPQEGICKHLRWLGDTVAQTGPDGRVCGYKRPFELASVALCLNEGGHNCTTLCLECADEVRRAASQTDEQR